MIETAETEISRLKKKLLIISLSRTVASYRHHQHMQVFFTAIADSRILQLPTPEVRPFAILQISPFAILQTSIF